LYQQSNNQILVKFSKQSEYLLDIFETMYFLPKQLNRKHNFHQMQSYLQIYEF
jgi:DNA-binding FadR family transcriptional regulator